jgi:hypothetical protein
MVDTAQGSGPHRHYFAGGGPSQTRCIVLRVPHATNDSVCATGQKAKHPANEKFFIPFGTRSYAPSGTTRAQNFVTIRATQSKGRGTLYPEIDPRIYDLRFMI